MTQSEAPEIGIEPVRFGWAKLCIELRGHIEWSARSSTALLWFQENFYSHPVDTFAIGSFSVSVKRARLQIPLTNAEMPLGDRFGVVQLAAGHPITYSSTSGQSAGLELAGASKVNADFSATGAKLGIEGANKKTSRLEARETTVGGADVLPAVVAGGSSKVPSWQYEAVGARQILVGSVGKRLLGKLHVHEIPFAVRFQLELRARDLEFTGLSGLVPERVSSDINRFKILKILLWMHLKPQLEPFLIDETVEVPQ